MLGAPVPVFSGGREWQLSQVVPTASGTYVVATRTQAGRPLTAVRTGLYLVRAGRLVAVRSLDDPGTLTPVTPLAAG